MAIPDYQTLMLPVLKLAADLSEHKFSQAVEELADCLEELLSAPGRLERFTMYKNCHLLVHKKNIIAEQYMSIFKTGLGQT